MVKRFTYDTIEEHRKKGEPGHDLTDPEVRGLAYQKQGSRVYARLPVMTRAPRSASCTRGRARCLRWRSC